MQRNFDKSGQTWTLMDRTCGLYWTQAETSEILWTKVNTIGLSGTKGQNLTLLDKK